MRSIQLLLLLCILLPAVCQTQSRYVPVRTGAVRAQPYAAYTVIDSLGREITFYLSDASSSERLPLVVYVHGSGHTSHFQRAGERVSPANGHATLGDVARGRARVLIVEKPGVARYDRGDQPASTTFREEHTLERWAEAVAAAMIAAGRLVGVDSTRSLVVGHSEGALVAARVAARLPAASHVAVLAGGGPSQLLDLLLLARTGAFFAELSPDPATREAHVRAEWDSILASPDAPDRFFLGHPYRRWASFLRDSPIARLRQSSAKVFIAQGELDRAVSRESFESLAAELTGMGRRPVVWLMPHADHSFLLHVPGRAPEDGWPVVLARVLEWYLGSRATAGQRGSMHTEHTDGLRVKASERTLVRTPATPTTRGDPS